MAIAKQGIALFAGLIALVGVERHALAASPVTDAFLANLQANVAFLDRSSEIVAAKTATSGIRDFARGEVAEQTHLASALDSLMPLLASTESVQTGRSVAIDGSPGLATDHPAPQAANGRSALAQAELDKLAAVSGRALDDLYWQTQLDALSQIEADYRAYIARGDDPALVGMAKTELPKILHRVELLSRI